MIIIFKYIERARPNAGIASHVWKRPTAFLPLPQSSRTFSGSPTYFSPLLSNSLFVSIIDDDRTPERGERDQGQRGTGAAFQSATAKRGRPPFTSNTENHRIQTSPIQRRRRMFSGVYHSLYVGSPRVQNSPSLCRRHPPDARPPFLQTISHPSYLYFLNVFKKYHELLILSPRVEHRFIRRIESKSALSRREYKN